MANQVTKSIIVKAPLADVYRLWSNFESFPYFMKHVKSVEKTGDKMSHWEVQGPLGQTVYWDAEMTRLEENKRIGWSTKDNDGTITTSGQVSFNALPQDRIEVTVMFQYVPPAGKAGAIVTRLFSNPEEKLDEDLRNFKAYAEGMLNRTAV